MIVVYSCEYLQWARKGSDPFFVLLPRVLAINVFGVALMTALPARSESTSPFPSHCLSGEFAVANARMATIDHSTGQPVLEKNGKILSLCSDKPIEPFTQFSYRYGPIGKVEFERKASQSKLFAIYRRSTSPHTGDDIVFFRSGQFTYYVAIAGGMGRGVSLHVFDHNKKILNLFSGTDGDRKQAGSIAGKDFQIGEAEMNFDSAESRIFVYQRPRHAF